MRKVTHAVNVDKINRAVKTLDSMPSAPTNDHVTSTRVAILETMKILVTLRTGSRDKATRVLDEKLSTFCGLVADQDHRHDSGLT